MKTHRHAIIDIAGLNTELDIMHSHITTLHDKVEALTKKLKGQ